MRLVSQRIVIKTVPSFSFPSQIIFKMSSSNSHVNLRIPNSSWPPSLVTAATSLYMASKDGKISQAEARTQGQLLIQANKQATNLAIVNQISKK